MKLKIRLREAAYWYVKRPAGKLGIKLIWALPRRVAMWAFIRVATADYNGNPGERTVLDALKSWKLSGR